MCVEFLAITTKALSIHVHHVFIWSIACVTKENFTNEQDATKAQGNQ
ncbi:MAG: hypothetical protein Q4A31_12195 [Corynebacterium sp.]|nr:hypothetical protein [Corynebacterium sp.]MDO4762673.1 hypothetical protein [Corynebacterium sp.]